MSARTAEFGETMQALAVVDTIRGEIDKQSESVGGTDSGRRVLERMREHYAAQGVVVPEGILAAGIAFAKAMSVTEGSTSNRMATSLPPYALPIAFIGPLAISMVIVSVMRAAGLV